MDKTPRKHVIMAGPIVNDTFGDDKSLEKLTRFLSPAKDKSIDTHLKETMFEGLVRLRSDERYRNDDRYLKLWMRYADLTDDASKVFLMLKSYNICTKLALFWAAWAYVLEMGELYSEAFEVLSQGKIRGAQPVTLLEEFEGTFYNRMWERMRVAHSNGAKYAIKREALFTINTQSHGAKPRSSAIGEQLIGSSIPLQSPSTSSRSMQDSRCPSGPEALLRVADSRKVHTIMVPGLRRNRVWNHQGGGRDKTADQKLADDDVEIIRDTGRGKEIVVPANNPLRERDGNVEAQKHTRDSTGRMDPDKKSAPVEKASLVVRDPLSQDVRKGLTVESAQYVRWTSSHDGIVHDVRHESLAKRWPRKMSNAKLGSRRRIVSSRTLGTQRLEVMSVLGKGAFATVYACKIHDVRRQVAVKIEHEEKAPSLPWEFFVTLQLRDRLLHRRQDTEPTRLEPDIEVTVPETLHIFRDGCAMTMPLGRSGTLHDLVVLYQKNAQAMPQLVAMHFTVQMLRFCRAMHSTSILHMDIKPDNWLLTTAKRPACGMGPDDTGADVWGSLCCVSLIDFGRAIDLSVFPDNGSAVSFTGICCPSSFSCPAMLEGRAWKYDADLFALGSCVYFMLHGVHLEVCCDEVQECGSVCSGRVHRWRPKRPCKRYWEVDLWNYLFDELLNNDRRGNHRVDAEAILNHLESLLSSFLMDSRRSLKLAELLRRQDSMINSNI